MATIGVRDLFYAPITENQSGAETYGTPVRLAKAVQIGMSTTVADGNLFADDAVDISVKEFVSGSLTLNVNDIEPKTKALLLGQEEDELGAVIAHGDDEAPSVAIGFRATKMGGKFKFVWLYKVKFGIPDENYQTKNESINFQTPTIVGTYIKRNDGNWKIDYVGTPNDAVGSVWFDEVREKVESTG